MCLFCNAFLFWDGLDTLPHACWVKKLSYVFRLSSRCGRTVANALFFVSWTWIVRLVTIPHKPDTTDTSCDWTAFSQYTPLDVLVSELLPTVCWTNQSEETNRFVSSLSAHQISFVPPLIFRTIASCQKHDQYSTAGQPWPKSYDRDHFCTPTWRDGFPNIPSLRPKS